MERSNLLKATTGRCAIEQGFRVPGMQSFTNPLLDKLALKKFADS